MKLRRSITERSKTYRLNFATNCTFQASLRLTQVDLGYRSMNFKQFAVIVVIGLFATTVWSGEERHQKIEIKVISDDGGDRTHFVLDSDELGFNLHDMQVGENQSVVDKEGRAVLITRTEDGFSFEVDGKTIDMPAFGGHHEKSVWVSKGEFAPDVDVDVRVMRKGMHPGMAPHAMMQDEGVMIISSEEIDAATQQVIRTALESAGHESVHFVGGGVGGPHRIHVIEKVVEVRD